MSEDTYVRNVEWRKVEYAAILFTAKQARKRVSMDITTQQVEELLLPMFVGVHPENRERARDLIALQLMEVATTYIYDVQEPVGLCEQLFAVHTQQVWNILYKPVLSPEYLHHRLKHVKRVIFAATWQTIKDAVRRMDDPTGIVAERTQLPSSGKSCLKFELFRLIWGSKIEIIIKDAVPEAPRMTYIKQEVIPSLMEILSGDEPVSRDNLNKTLDLVRGENYAGYVAPSEEELANEGMKLICWSLKDGTEETAITFEDSMSQAIQKFYPEFFLRNFLMAGTTWNPIKESDLYWGITVSNQTVIVTPSFFMLMAEEATENHRLKAGKGIMHMSTILHQANVCTTEEMVLVENRVETCLTQKYHLLGSWR